MERKDFYDHDTYESLLGRLGRLTAQTAPRWGKMSSAQMCAHCSEVAEVAAGKPLENTPWFIRLMGGFIKKMVLKETPYPRDARTHPQYQISATVTFDEQKARLLDVLAMMHSAGPAQAGDTKHPLFGTLTADEHGWLTYKHLDHHLTQFGV